ncbi:MAG: sulfatase-like hydrolase/transferase [Bythopirellula sp.]
MHKQFLLILIFIFLSTHPSQATKPNVLFIPVDDLSDWVSHLGGHSQAVTPNLDRLAAMGLTFTSAHCAVPSSNPSREALLTGLHPAKILS